MSFFVDTASISTPEQFIDSVPFIRRSPYNCTCSGYSILLSSSSSVSICAIVFSLSLDTLTFSWKIPCQYPLLVNFSSSFPRIDLADAFYLFQVIPRLVVVLCHRMAHRIQSPNSRWGENVSASRNSKSMPPFSSVSISISWHVSISSRIVCNRLNILARKPSGFFMRLAFPWDFPPIRQIAKRDLVAASEMFTLTAAKQNIIFVANEIAFLTAWTLDCFFSTVCRFLQVQGYCQPLPRSDFLFASNSSITIGRQSAPAVCLKPAFGNTAFSCVGINCLVPNYGNYYVME